MRKLGSLLIALALFGVAGCDMTEVVIEGDGNCVPIFKTQSGNIVMECFTGPTTSELACFSDSGTRLHESECEEEETE